MNDFKNISPCFSLYFDWFNLMIKHWRISLFILMLLLACRADAKHRHLEKYYQNLWCNSHAGQQEVVLNDGSRADCITQDYAIEFDFAKKYQESIGQSLEYSLQTGKTAGIVLIMENYEADQKFLNRLLPVANKYNIKVWTMP